MLVTTPLVVPNTHVTPPTVWLMFPDWNLLPPEVITAGSVLPVKNILEFVVFCVSIASQ